MLPASYATKSWTRLLPDTALYEKYAGKDDGRGEWDLKDTTFPHVFPNKPPEPAYYTYLTRTPFSDEILLQVALRVLNAYHLGTRASPDLLAVSFSAPDVIGHTYGAYSQELMDEYLRLDAILGNLLDAVEKRVGEPNLLVVLTADHGSTPLVEWLQDHGHPEAVRRRTTALSDPVNEALKKQYPSAPNLIASFSSPDFYLDLEAIRKAGLKREDVERTVIRALMSTGIVEKVYTHADLYWKPPGSDAYIDLFRNSFFASRSPHLMVLLKRYTYVSTNVGGTGHGTAHEYDRHVPIVWMGPAIPHGRYDALAGPEDIAPTLAKMLDIPFPVESDARLLTELLK
jgi:type I phosphodiesterase/nucleotide pyrophosphatase